jgi:hypothetical protein
MSKSRRKGPVLREVEKAIAAAPPGDHAAGLVALARTYAGAIDEASELAAWAAELPVPENGNDRQALEALQRRVGLQAALKDIGPRLEATLTQLGLTPAGRTAVVSAFPTPAVTTLQRLRSNHLERMQRMQQAPEQVS